MVNFISLIFKTLASFFRKTTYSLVTNEITYYPAMVFIRIGRLMKKWYFKNVGDSSMKRITIFNNVNIEILMDSYMGASFYWTGLHHVNQIAFLSNYLKPNFTFIDVGANLGEFTLFAASKLSKGKVIAFEPVNKQLNMLKLNCSLNQFDNIIIEEYGLSDSQRKIEIFTSYSTDLFDGIHEGLSTLFPSDSKFVVEQVIPLKVFDDEYFDSLESFDFLKIDIEGGELFALRGMQKSIQKFKPAILIEMNNLTFNAAGYSVEEVANFLFSFGYKLYDFKRGKLVPLNIENLRKMSDYLFKVN